MLRYVHLGLCAMFGAYAGILLALHTTVSELVSHLPTIPQYAHCVVSEQPEQFASVGIAEFQETNLYTLQRRTLEWYTEQGAQTCTYIRKHGETFVSEPISCTGESYLTQIADLPVSRRLVCYGGFCNMVEWQGE